MIRLISLTSARQIKFRCSMSFRNLIPRANFLAYITTIYPFSHFGNNFLRNRIPVFYCQVSYTFSCINCRVLVDSSCGDIDLYITCIFPHLLAENGLSYSNSMFKMRIPIKKNEPISLFIITECLPCQPSPASTAHAFSSKEAVSANAFPLIAGFIFLNDSRTVLSFFSITV